MTAHILVVDDDARLRRLLAQYLSREGWCITTAATAADARRKMEFFLFDLIVLDVMMPGESGIAFAHSLKEHSAPPILMLTAVGEAEERIAGLESGAEDYLVKPFEPRELALRIRNLLRRGAHASSEADAGCLRFGAFFFYPESSRLLRGEEPVYLTTAETQLLTLLAQRRGEAVSRAELAAALPGETSGERGVDVQITRLRKKIEAEPGRPVYLQTLRGTGYTLKI
jgi:two-component system phosphate regulon response regulator OmpR